MSESEKAMKLICHGKAESMWATFTEQEKNMTRFGMFPADKMLAATKEGHDARLLSVALMKRAANDGGMVC